MRVRILVVDDSPSMRTVIRAVLEDDGYEVAASEDGEEALASFQATTPDLVITDIYMSRMDGLTLVRGIRALPACRFLPILVLTTEAGEEMKQRGRAAGATGWIVKPFEPDQLREVVGRLLRLRGARA
ncbi:MAG TPA: response regulator [Methylomirabilota bacterium]|nr:response regulator [Methylomirabilota bacterium]